MKLCFGEVWKLTKDKRIYPREKYKNSEIDYKLMEKEMKKELNFRVDMFNF